MTLVEFDLSELKDGASVTVVTNGKRVITFYATLDIRPGQNDHEITGVGIKGVTDYGDHPERTRVTKILRIGGNLAIQSPEKTLATQIISLVVHG